MTVIKIKGLRIYRDRIEIPEEYLDAYLIIWGCMGACVLALILYIKIFILREF